MIDRDADFLKEGVRVLSQALMGRCHVPARKVPSGSASEATGLSELFKNS